MQQKNQLKQQIRNQRKNNQLAHFLSLSALTSLLYLSFPSPPSIGLILLRYPPSPLEFTFNSLYPARLFLVAVEGDDKIEGEEEESEDREEDRDKKAKG